MRFVLGGVLLVSWSLLGVAAPREKEEGPLDQAIRAMGGASKLAKLKTGTGKGQITMQDGGKQFNLTFDASWQGLTQYRIEGDAMVDGRSDKGRIIINGDQGWAQGDNDNNAKDLGKDVSFIKNVFLAGRLPQLLPALKGKNFKLAPLGEIKIDDRPAVGLRVSHKGFKDVSLFFDKTTHLPVKSEVQDRDPSGKEITVEFYYSEYKDYDGVKQPAKVLIKLDGKQLTMEASEIHPAEKLEDNVFDKP